MTCVRNPDSTPRVSLRVHCRDSNDLFAFWMSTPGTAFGFGVRREQMRQLKDYLVKLDALLPEPEPEARVFPHPQETK